MDKNVQIAWAEDKACAQLERSFARFVLTVAGSLSLFAGDKIVSPAEMEKAAFLEACDPVGTALFIDQQGKSDPHLIAKKASVVNTPKANGSKGSASFLNLRLVIAQLRDMVTAENSSIVAQEDKHRWA